MTAARARSCRQWPAAARCSGAARHWFGDDDPVYLCAHGGGVSSPNMAAIWPGKLRYYRIDNRAGPVRCHRAGRVAGVNVAEHGAAYCLEIGAYGLAVEMWCGSRSPGRRFARLATIRRRDDAGAGWLCCAGVGARSDPQAGR